MSRIPSLVTALAPADLAAFFPEPMLAELRAVTADFRTLDPTAHPAADFARALAAADPAVLVTGWKTPHLPAALPPRLRYVCHVTGSVKKLVSRAHLDGGLAVSNWGGSISRTVAEGALFHILACLRHASHWAVAMHQPGVAAWKNGLSDVRSLFGRTVGIHGFGLVARELVALLRPWGCRVTVFAPDASATLAAAYGVACAGSLEELFSANEIIVELAPLTPSTTGIVTEALLRLIRPGGTFVNVGRGAVVDEAALLRVAREGRINVGLDVYTTEPLSADSGFRALPRVNLTPHNSGPTFDHYPVAGAFALRNLRAFAAGQPIEALITPAIYDASS
ncbi:MAG: hydroxyacid dehydrogenase [Opitutaceae bacterium]|nr:hydroxyacid dehydrogenase [Opitutaceae bacterium]